MVLLLALALRVPAEAESLALQWKEVDQEAVELLLDGRYKKARKELDRVLDEMVERMGPGVGGKLAMGLVLMHRALAEAGLGNKRDALWDWHVALNLSPSLEDQDLGRFGAPGRLLEVNLLREPYQGEGSETGGGDRAVRVYSFFGGSSEFDPPKKRKSPRPVFPDGASAWGIEGTIVINMIITEEGDVVRPRVLRDLDAATITYSALEALRKWRFRPARLGGERVPVFYNLTVNYDLPWKDD